MFKVFLETQAIAYYPFIELIEHISAAVFPVLPFGIEFQVDGRSTVEGEGV
jgi:hypothetical protein